MFHAVGLYDDLVATPLAPGSGVVLHIEGEEAFGVPLDGTNLAARAVEALLPYGASPDVSLTIHKGIPVAGGKTISELLTESIAQHGVLQPILVTETAAGYQLIAGERRLRAAELAGLIVIPAVVRSANPNSQLQVASVGANGEIARPTMPARSEWRFGSVGASATA